MLKTPISIKAVASVSPLGTSPEEIWANYVRPAHFLVEKKIGNITAWMGSLPSQARNALEEVRRSDSKYANLDDSVLMALFAARKAVQNAKWTPDDNFGVNIGSSRGATGLFEKYHETFTKSGQVPTLCSPTTTLGNISSWVAHDLRTKGPEISHSITCSTALHAVLNGVAWIQAGMADKFLVGGSEAPLTPFTLAQMRALKIYAPTDGPVTDFPCRSLHMDKKNNTMVLGEGASIVCLEKGSVHEGARARIIGVGCATEVLKHNISISSNAICFQRSMKMALGEMDPEEIDAIVMHAPGTIKGDISEYNAISEVFGRGRMPALTSNKWKIGHTFGASGMLSVELALMMIERQAFIPIPYLPKRPGPEKILKVLVNAVGFGGNAVSILLEGNR